MGLWGCGGSCDPDWRKGESWRLAPLEREGPPMLIVRFCRCDCCCCYQADHLRIGKKAGRVGLIDLCPQCWGLAGEYDLFETEQNFLRRMSYERLSL
jgi:hypothetical protein